MDFLKEYITFKNDVSWKRDVFYTFVRVFCESSTSSFNKNHSTYSPKVISDILKYIIIPMIEYSFDKDNLEQLVGTDPSPEIDNENNLISVFINKLIDTENINTQSDSIRIHLLHLSGIFVQRAHNYIHDVNNKKQGTQLRRLMTFAWPCLLIKTCVDPVNKYNGLLLLSHIISKFAIHKRIVLQVFHSLLKAFNTEAKLLVRQALDILTPTFTSRIEEGYFTLSTWVKKILIEENHSVSQIAHICWIIVRFEKVFFVIRHSLINQLMISIQKISLAVNSTLENRTIALDLAEVIMKWEAKRLIDINDPIITDSAKNHEITKPFEKHVGEFILNFYLRIALIDFGNPNINTSSVQHNINHNQVNENICKRGMRLFKLALSTNVFPNSDVKIEFIEKIMMTIELSFFNNPLISVLNIVQNNNYQNQTQPNYLMICNCLEILTLLIGNTDVRAKIQQILKTVQKGLSYTLISINNRVIRHIGILIEKIMSIIPNESFNYSSSTFTNNNPYNNEFTNLSQNNSNDPIYFLFGQPEGNAFFSVILDIKY